MRQDEFVQRYQSHWQAFAQQLEQMEASKIRVKESAFRREFPQLYRQLCYCLALAKSRHYSPNLVNYLDDLVLRGHQIFYRGQRHFLQKIIRFIMAGFAQAVRRHWRYLLAASLIFYLPAIISFTLTQYFPEFVYVIVPQEQVAMIEKMYQPSQEIFGRERSSDSDFLMFGHYIRNNIGIAFQTFAGGIVFTLGSLFYLTFNGLFFGTLSSHMLNENLQQTFFSFVSGHAAFELTGIVISGAAGLMLGWSLIAPGNYSRKQALVNAGRKAVKLMYGAIFFLLIAAFIEAFWSSSSSVDAMVKYWVAAGLWSFVLLYFIFAGRHPYADDETPLK